MVVFRLHNPLFPIIRIWAPVRGQTDSQDKPRWSANQILLSRQSLDSMKSWIREGLTYWEFFLL